MTALDDQKRMLLPFLQRADEIEKHDPKVAYYCRMYAVEQGLAIPKNERDPKITGLLNSLLVKLEATKPGALLAGEQADKAYLEDFALKVFHRADKVDRAGLADKKTAVTYLASFYFFEILAQFGELAPDVAEKQRYAAWRAADINKALREGRTPTPVPTADGLDGGLDPSGDPHPSATEEGQEEADEDDDFGLPEPPSTQHPPTPALPPMRAGSRVLFMDLTVGGQAVRGTVARVDGDTLHVALADRIVAASRTQLVFELHTDDDACYHHGGGVEMCSVEAVDLQHWPPSYTVLLRSGSVRDVSGEHLVPAEAEPSAPTEVEDAPQAPLEDAPQAPLLGKSSGPAQDSHPIPPSALPSAPPPAASTPPAAPPPVPCPSTTSAAPPARAVPPTVSSQPPPSMPGFQPGLAAISEAHKQAKYAVSSLSFEDVPTAIKHLTQALRLLTSPQQ